MAQTTTGTLNTEGITIITNNAAGNSYRRSRTTGELTLNIAAGSSVTAICRVGFDRSTTAAQGVYFEGMRLNYRVVSGTLTSVNRTLERQDYINGAASSAVNLTATQLTAPTLTASANNYQVADGPAVAETFVTLATSTTVTYVYTVVFTATTATELIIRCCGLLTGTDWDGNVVGLTGFTNADNTGLGVGAGDSITSGIDNTAIGVNAGTAISTGSGNTLLGDNAGAAITTASRCVGIGYATLTTNVAANDNTAVGYEALISAGFSGVGQNAALGYQAGAGITTGTYNVCIGATADVSSATGTNRIALGRGAVVQNDHDAQIGNRVDNGSGVMFFHTQEVSREDWIGNGQTAAVIDNSGNIARATTDTVNGDGAGKDAISLATRVTFIDTTGGGSDLTLGLGATGQEKILTMTGSGANAVLDSVDGNLAEAVTINWTGVGQSVHLVFNGSKWAIVASRGATIA